MTEKKQLSVAFLNINGKYFSKSRILFVCENHIFQREPFWWDIPDLIPACSDFFSPLLPPPVPCQWCSCQTGMKVAVHCHFFWINRFPKMGGPLHNCSDPGHQRQSSAFCSTLYKKNWPRSAWSSFPASLNSWLLRVAAQLCQPGTCSSDCHISPCLRGTTPSRHIVIPSVGQTRTLQYMPISKR